MDNTGNAAQGMLFDITCPADSGNGVSAFRDPAFANNKTAPVHRWVPWIAGFSREFVQGALRRHLSRKGTVLDPFAGVGTALVEAMLAGHDAVGFEINPYAALVCRTKLTAYELGGDYIEEAIENLKRAYRRAASRKNGPLSTPPAGFRTRAAFYSPAVLRKVLLIQDCISEVDNSALRDLLRVAFASTLVTYSNYSYEPSLGRRASVGRDDIDDFPVAETVVQKLRQMARDVAWMQRELNGCRPKSHVFNESFFGCQKRLDSGSVDLLVTSPPYVNNYHYNRNTRPHLYWLGFVEAPRDLKPLEQANFGKFWQTVRELECVDLDFEMPDDELRTCLQEVRQKTPEKGIYGGNGWANYAASYFNDCHRFAKCAKYVLKRRGTALVVIGNSILQGVMIPTDRFFGRIAELVGLDVVDIHVPRATRVGNSIIHSDVRVAKAKKSDSLYEAVVELRKR